MKVPGNEGGCPGFYLRGFLLLFPHLLLVISQIKPSESWDNSTRLPDGSRVVWYFPYFPVFLIPKTYTKLCLDFTSSLSCLWWDSRRIALLDKQRFPYSSILAGYRCHKFIVTMFTSFSSGITQIWSLCPWGQNWLQACYKRPAERLFTLTARFVPKDTHKSYVLHNLLFALASCEARLKERLLAEIATKYRGSQNLLYPP